MGISYEGSEYKIRRYIETLRAYLTMLSNQEVDVQLHSEMDFMRHYAFRIHFRRDNVFVQHTLMDLDIPAEDIAQHVIRKFRDYVDSRTKEALRSIHGRVIAEKTKTPLRQDMMDAMIYPIMKDKVEQKPSRPKIPYTPGEPPGYQQELQKKLNAWLA